MKLIIDNQLVGLAELREVWRRPVTVELGNEARCCVAESNELIIDVLAGGDQVYGVNTGFGQLAQVRVSNEDLALKEPGNLATFGGLYFDWLGNLMNSGKAITGYVVDVDWLPRIDSDPSLQPIPPDK